MPAGNERAKAAIAKVAAADADIARLVGDRKIIATRILNAPRELVWKAWTDADHLAAWWGPRGFETTTFSIDVKVGGVWRFVMHGPDGRDYPNEITYLELVKNTRLVYRHGGDRDTVIFNVIVQFEDVGGGGGGGGGGKSGGGGSGGGESNGGKTKLTMEMEFPSGEARDRVIKEYGADKGLNETIGRLGEYVSGDPDAPDRPFSTQRTFDAPRELVWKAWTERDRMTQWFGPKGFTMSKATVDFRVGGTTLYCLRSADGKEMWGKFVYREIIPPQRIVWVNSFSDEHGGLTRHPMSPTWPREMLTTATFAESPDGKTTVTIRWSPINATAEEIKTFNDNREGMKAGWGGTFDGLVEYLRRERE